MLKKGLKFLKDQRGLTLIELLAVIVVLGIIAAIAIPSINGTINNSKVKADEQSEIIIQDAAMRYAIDAEIDETADDQSISEKLVDGGYLNAVPDYQQDSTKEFKTFDITVATNGNYTITVDAPTAP